MSFKFFVGQAVEYTPAGEKAAGLYKVVRQMPEEEQVRRMERMRTNVREHNVYRWAAHLLSDLTEIRIDAPERVEVPQIP